MKNRNVSLSDKERSVILGSLLGDGSLKLHKKYRNARFSFRHSIRQKDYFYWKTEQLKRISGKVSIFVQENDGPFGKNRKLRYQSRALPSLTELYELTHKKGKFTIRRKWLNKMTPLSLAIWWFDDGSLITNTRKGVFCTDGFNEKSVKVLARYLDVIWNINSKVAPVGKKRGGNQDKYFRLWIRSNSELKKFLRIVLPHVPTKSMLYKVLILYKDIQLQQRWISEIENLSKFSREEIEEVARERKSKLKFFRE